MAGVEGSPGFYTFVRHFGKMGPPSSLLFLTVDRGKMEGYRRKKDERQHQPHHLKQQHSKADLFNRQEAR